MRITMVKLEEQIQILDFPDLGDERGNLVVVEGGSAIPFEIKRIFYIYGSDSEVVRGDNGHEKRVVELNRPRMGLYLKNNVWKEMYDFSPDSVLLVLSNEHYDPAEYIRDYGAYLELMRKEKEDDE